MRNGCTVPLILSILALTISIGSSTIVILSIPNRNGTIEAGRILVGRGKERVEIIPGALFVSGADSSGDMHDVILRDGLVLAATTDRNSLESNSRSIMNRSGLTITWMRANGDEYTFHVGKGFVELTEGGVTKEGEDRRLGRLEIDAEGGLRARLFDAAGKTRFDKRF